MRGITCTWVQWAILPHKTFFNSIACVTLQSSLKKVLRSRQHAPTHLKDFCHSDAFETGLTTLNALNDRPIYDRFWTPDLGCTCQPIPYWVTGKYCASEYGWLLSSRQYQIGSLWIRIPYSDTFILFLFLSLILVYPCYLYPYPYTYTYTYPFESARHVPRRCTLNSKHLSWLECIDLSAQM